MALRAEQVVQLHDAEGREIGKVVVKRLQEDLVFGQFQPGEAFTRIQPLFDEFNELVDNQILSLLDELDTRITALGLHLRSDGGAPMPEIYDVQIGGGTINFRLRGGAGDVRE